MTVININNNVIFTKSSILVKLELIDYIEKLEAYSWEWKEEEIQVARDFLKNLSLNVNMREEYILNSPDDLVNFFETAGINIIEKTFEQHYFDIIYKLFYAGLKIKMTHPIEMVFQEIAEKAMLLLLSQRNDEFNLMLSAPDEAKIKLSMEMSDKVWFSAFHFLFESAYSCSHPDFNFKNCFYTFLLSTSPDRVIRLILNAPL